MFVRGARRFELHAFGRRRFYCEALAKMRVKLIYNVLFTDAVILSGKSTSPSLEVGGPEMKLSNESSLSVSS